MAPDHSAGGCEGVLEFRALFSSPQTLSGVCKLELGKLSSLCFLGGDGFVQSLRMGTQVKGRSTNRKSQPYPGWEPKSKEGVPAGSPSHTACSFFSLFSPTHCPVLSPFCFSIFLVWCWQGTGVFPLDPFWFSNRFCADITMHRVNGHCEEQMSLC